MHWHICKHFKECGNQYPCISNDCASEWTCPECRDLEERDEYWQNNPFQGSLTLETDHPLIIHSRSKDHERY
jgi:hypothetical protein